MARMVEMRDPYTAGHQERVAVLAQAMGWEMGLDEGTLRVLNMGARIHDIGKIGVPSDILAKPGRISDAEFELIKAHTQIGDEILRSGPPPEVLPAPIREAVPAIIRSHHERLDGSGYPDRLQGNEIPLEARIVAVADVVEAMISHRPYRPGLGVDTALEAIERERGDKLDAEAVDACLRLFREEGFQFPET